MTLYQRLQDVKNRLADSSRRSGRDPEAVTLLAVTKTFSPSCIQEAYDCGLRSFGENRVQESLEKMPLLPADIHWHLIGQLQTNKINKIIGKFELVHSIDSLELAQALAKRLGSHQQDILLEVNTSGEASKSGVEPQQAIKAAQEIASLSGLRLRGLMTVGPLTENRHQQRDAFKHLKELFDETVQLMGSHCDILSMGMSGDFEMAIEEGSTLVRVGSAIFGFRS
jgi:pyridoxal phosphate enzyme (YggS family)